jgi:uncharacterized protein (TIGR02001 family)
MLHWRPTKRLNIIHWGGIMRKHLSAWITAIVLGLPAVQAAEVSVAPTIASEYDFRGITQTKGDPAFQLGIDYSTDAGFFASVWGTNVDFDSETDMELDLIVGWAGGSDELVNWQVGLIRYTYPDEGALNFTEGFVGLSKGWWSGKFSYSWDMADEEAYYAETGLSVPLPHAFGLELHAGYSGGDAWGSNEYFDYSVGVTRNIGNFGLALKFTDTSGYDGGGSDDLLSGDSKVVFTVSTTLPWK